MPRPAFVAEIRAAARRAASDDRADALAYDDGLVIVVADGAGGMTGGAAAADAVVDAVRERVGSGKIDPHDVRSWCELLEETDAGLARARGGESTATVVVVDGRGIVGVSAGDSEAWVLSAAGIDRLTEDQARRRMGSGRIAVTSFGRPRLEGTLVVATDGLFKYVDSASIVSACAGGSVTAAADALVSLPLLASGARPDDVAVVVVRTRDE